MTKPIARSFSRDFKLRVLERIGRGETISALSAEFGVHRQLLCKWRDAARAGTLGARRGRPTRAEALARAGDLAERSELEAARRLMSAALGRRDSQSTWLNRAAIVLSTDAASPVQLARAGSVAGVLSRQARHRAAAWRGSQNPEQGRPL